MPFKKDPLLEIAATLAGAFVHIAQRQEMLERAIARLDGGQQALDRVNDGMEDDCREDAFPAAHQVANEAGRFLTRFQFPLDLAQNIKGALDAIEKQEKGDTASE